MKTLGSRLALSYSLASTVTVIAVLAVGFFLLNRHLARSTDLLNVAECDRLKAALGPDLLSATPEQVRRRISSAGAGETSAFFVEISRPASALVFRSPNLAGQSLPDSQSREAYSATVPGIGQVRIQRLVFEGGVIAVGTSMALASQVTDGYAQICILLVSLTLLASLAAGLGLSHFALRPIRVIQDTAYRIGSDNLDERIPIPDVEDEISDLARLMNEMFDRLESSFQQIRRFTAEASHELKTPLSLVRLHAEKLLSDGSLAPGQEEALQSQLEEITRLNQIIEELLFLSKAEAGAVAPQMVRENPGACLEAFVLDAQILAEHAGVRFEAVIEGSQPASFDRKWIRQILLNLVGNALRISPPGSLITLRSAFTIDQWRLEVEDEGPGVSVEDRERIFERFVRLKSASGESPGGTGLGLAICRSMVEMQGGRIRAEQGKRRGGLCVVCELPMVSAPENARPIAGATENSPSSTMVPD